MTRQEHRCYWQGEFTRFRASGQSARAFCRERNLKYFTFRRWRRIFEGDRSALIPASFTKVEIDKEPAIVQVRLPMGIEIRSAHHPEPEWVVKLMREMAWGTER